MSYLFWMSYVVLWIVAVVLIIAVLLIIRQIGLVYLNTSDGISRSGLRIGSAVPDISIRTLEGEDIRLSSLASRLPLLVFNGLQDKLRVGIRDDRLLVRQLFSRSAHLQGLL